MRRGLYWRGGLLYRCTGSRTGISHPILDKNHIIYMSEKSWKSREKGALFFAFFDLLANACLFFLAFSYEPNQLALRLICFDWTLRASFTRTTCNKDYHSLQRRLRKGYEGNNSPSVCSASSNDRKLKRIYIHFISQTFSWS